MSIEQLIGIVSKQLQTLSAIYIFHDLRDKDAVSGQNLPNTYKVLGPPLCKLATSTLQGICQKLF